MLFLSLPPSILKFLTSSFGRNLLPNSLSLLHFVPLSVSPFISNIFWALMTIKLWHFQVFTLGKYVNKKNDLGTYALAWIYVSMLLCKYVYIFSINWWAKLGEHQCCFSMCVAFYNLCCPQLATKLEKICMQDCKSFKGDYKIITP